MPEVLKTKRIRPNLDSTTNPAVKLPLRSMRFAHPPAFWSLLALIALPCPAFCRASQPSLAIIGAGVQQAEDSPPVSSEFRFLQGDTLYFTFQIAGFHIKSEHRDEIRTISLAFEAKPEDLNGTALAEPVGGEIKTELSSEDKNWTPKRRVSFLLPSAVAAGDFRVHLTVKDLLAGTELSEKFPFHIGGIEIKSSGSLRVDDFVFLREENSGQPLAVAAYQPGDSVYAQFEMVGFKIGPRNEYRLAYDVTVLRPDGKVFIHQLNAARLTGESFYPAQYVPGFLDLKTSPGAPRGEYIVVLTVHDEIAHTNFEMKRAFGLE